MDGSGMDAERLERIRPAVERHIGPSRLAGAVSLVLRRDRVVHEACCGVMDRKSGRPMRPDALFRIYSMTKPITCVAALTLLERGLIQLFDPVAKFLPEFRGLKVFVGDHVSRGRLEDLERPVTIHHLFTHTAGLTYGYHEYGPVEQMYRAAPFAPQQSLADFVHRVASLPLAFQPGTRFRYSVAHDVLGRVIEVASGMRLDRYLEQTILRPLGMSDTGYIVPEDKLDRLVSMYGSMDISQPGVTVGRMLQEALSGTNRLLADARTSLQSQPHECFRGGTGLVSSARDYARFCRMLLAGGELEGVRILGRKTVELMTSNHLAPQLLPFEVGGRVAEGYGYGLGVRVLMDVAASGLPGSVGEYGWSGAASTYFWIDPREELIGVLMAQHQPSGLTSLAQDFRVAVYQAIAD